MKTIGNITINRRILVIDDNQDLHADFRKILAAPSRRDAGMDAAEAELFGTPETAASGSQEAVFELADAFQGQEGLQMVEKACAEKRPYAVAFVDMRMPPGWDGLETITHLWTADPHLQIVICTAYSDYSWQEIFARVGATDRLLIVKKPFDAVEIVQLAHALTEKWSLANEIEHQVEVLEATVQERTHDLSTTNQQLADSINDLRRSSEALRRSEERFRSIVDTAQSAIAIVDSYGRIDLWNPGAERTFGWSSAEAVGQPLTLVLPGLLSDDLRARLEQLLAEESASHGSISINGRKSDGESFPLEISLTPLNTERGRCFSCIMQDISLRKKAETEIITAKEAAEAATKAKSAFLASMSHEIRTPMAGIIGMADLLLRTPLDTEQRDFAGTLKTCAGSLLTLINDILDFSKIEAGRLSLEHLEFELRSVVEDTVALFSLQAQMRGIEMVSMIDAAVPIMVGGDPTRLRQVLSNLLGNAIKFTSQGEVLLKVLVAGFQEDRVCLRFEVIDSGIGISADAIGRLFQSFSQAEASISRRYGGTGLGLAICKRLVELMGGEIGCVSQQGKGSTFHFTLDLQVCARAQPLADADLTGLRVLCVDDNANARAAVQHLLAGWQMYCDTAPSGARALDMLRSAHTAGMPYGLLMLDLHMPDMDGMALARAVKADPALAAIPMLMLTDVAQRGQGAAAREAGILGYLTKPVRNSQFLSTIRMVVKAQHEESVVLVTQHTVTEQERLARPRVLVADDEYVCLKSACLMLEQLGCRVDTVDTGTRALEAILANRYALVFLDGQMPGLDGTEVAKAVRKQEPLDRHTPLIAFTAHALDTVRDQCLAAGMDDFLSKPAESKDLAALLKRWLPAFDAALLKPDAVNDGADLIDEETLAKAAASDGGEHALLVKTAPRLTQGVMGVIVAIAKVDPISLEHAAAGLRLTCAGIGATRIAGLAESLEGCGKFRDLAKAVQQLTALQRAWDATAVWIEKRLAK